MMQNFLLILFSVFFTTLCFKDLKMGIFLIIGLLPTYLIRFHFFSIPFTLLEVMIIITLCVFFYERKKSNDLRFIHSRYIQVLSFLMIISFLTLFYTPSLLGGLGIFKAYFLEPILLYFVLLNTLKKSDVKTVLIIFGLEVLYISIYAGYQFFSGDIPYPWNQNFDKRVTSIFEFPNAISLLTVPILCFYFASFWFGIKLFCNSVKDNIFKNTVFVFGCIAVFLSKSDGGILSLLIGFLIVILFSIKWKFKIKRSILVLIFSIVLFLSLVLINQNFKDSLFQQVTFQNNSSQVRLVLWEGTFKLLKERFFLGAGLDGFSYLYPEYKLARHTEILKYPHNFVLNFWVEIGFFGMFCFMYLLFIFFRNCYKKIVNEVTLSKSKFFYGSVMICMITLLIQGIVDVPYFKNDLAILFYIVLFLSEVDVSDTF